MRRGRGRGEDERESFECRQVQSGRPVTSIFVALLLIANVWETRSTEGGQEAVRGRTCLEMKSAEREWERSGGVAVVKVTGVAFVLFWV